ncbi:LacI family DNA-binding transcriptional regulator [Arthrobacter sp. H5]|uniref:LacI family DNA-binding transcriptional regulator n=1 Tax=Arthrobacter sp. H5 TaxID=1267973 RepID=UPI00048193DC|nr:LacI family DNA-binding transcriptional regulator [Arthrobacter sp. H5]
MTEPELARAKSVTLRDVARVAGVSVPTASKALNGREGVRAATRQAVLATAERLAFHPNTTARALKNGRSGTWGLITDDLEGRFSIPILMGAEDTAGAGKMSVFLCDARGDVIREKHHLQSLLGRQVDGLIIVGSRTDARASLGELPVPAIYVYAPSDAHTDLSIVPDNLGGGRLAAQHLLDLGRKRIAHIAGDRSYDAARARVTGVDEVLTAHNMELMGGQAFYGVWSEAWGRNATRRLVESSPDLDAVVCGSDQIARGVLDALKDLNLRVPEDVAVVSFDNWEVFATGAVPGLTSVDMNFEAMGRMAGEKLFAAMGGEEQQGTIIQPCRLVVRGSTCP